jgi:hypothetical protein
VLISMIVKYNNYLILELWHRPGFRVLIRGAYYTPF